MVLSNAERQRRFRQRLKERASGAALGHMAQEAMDEALAAAWAILNRPNADGRIWADIDNFADLTAYKQHFRDNLSELRAMLAAWLSPDEDTPVTDAERAAIERGLDVVRAAMLDHVPAPAPVGKARRRLDKSVRM